LAAVLAEAGAGTAVLPDEAEQLDLLGLRDVPEAKRGRGRPPGARNRSVQDVADYLLAKYRDPLETLVQMAGAGVEELAAALGCSRLEAWQEKRHAAVAALPYIRQRQPQAVNLGVSQAVHLTIVDMPGDEPRVSVGSMVEVVGNQRVIEADDDAV
jgi:hypothetical protein